MFEKLLLCWLLLVRNIDVREDREDGIIVVCLLMSLLDGVVFGLYGKGLEMMEGWSFEKFIEIDNN